MSNPVLVELKRGGLVESLHRGAVCVTRAEGEPLVTLGDCLRPVYPRSAIKIFQALPLVESGAADSHGFTDAELALACASHSGEPAHVETARAMLAKCGLDESALACGGQWPLGQEAALELAASGGTPGRLHNNCSGKHAGMLALAASLGADRAGYENQDHAVQQRVRETIEEMTGTVFGPEVCAVDGCSVPTWAAPLSSFASGFARLASRSRMSEARARAADRLVRACTSEPHMVEGTGRFGTGVMRRLGAGAFVKGGAEGVYCAAFSERGLGLAVKIDDGARRGAEAVAAFLVSAIVTGRTELAGELYDMDLANWRGTHVGEILPSEELKETLARLAP